MVRANQTMLSDLDTHLRGQWLKEYEEIHTHQWILGYWANKFQQRSQPQQELILPHFGRQ